MEDEEDIFVGDVVTCVLRIVRENELKEGVTPQQILAGEVKEEVSEVKEEVSEEEEVEGEESKVKEEKSILTAEEYERLVSESEKPEAVTFERGVVYSKK